MTGISRHRLVTGVFAALLVVTGGFILVARSTDALAANGALLTPSDAMYPRAVTLRHSGAANGRTVAVVTQFGSSGAFGGVHESTDGGRVFRQVGAVRDGLAGSGLCCTTLFELPTAVGAMPAGTLLWAGALAQNAADRRMPIRLHRSNDLGRTWSYVSTIATSPNTRGLWEPEFIVNAAGRLTVYFADESRPGHSQVLVQSTSADGVTWAPRTVIVAGPTAGSRPGMPTVRRLGTGAYLMSYEVCGQGGQYDCAVYTRTSPDGTTWGDPAALGRHVRNDSGQYFAHAPTFTVLASGRILAVAQMLKNGDGSTAGGNGTTVFLSDDNAATWRSVAAPVRVPSARNHPCPNYSSQLVPSADGRSLTEIATDLVGSSCKAYVATAPLPL